MISIISQGSLFFFPPARFMVRRVAAPFEPSRPAALLESRLLLDPDSNMARTSTKFPFLFMILTFCTGQSPVTGFNLLFWFPLDVSIRCRCGPLERTLKRRCFGIQTWVSFSSLFICRHRWWFFLHLSQVEPSGFLQSFA